jgi:zinc and cadmium transporter
MIWLWVSIMVALDGAAGLAGAALPERWLARYRPLLLGFAVGALIASALGELIPEARAQGGIGVLAWSGAAIVGMASVEWLLGRRRGHARAVMPVALLTADALHNICDGMAIAAAFLVSTRLGLVTSAAVIVHEIPEEVADYALLRSAQIARLPAVLALAAVQLTAAIGAAGTLAASSLVNAAAPVLLAVAAGTFVHIAVIDLGPELVRGRRPMAVFACGLGAVLVLAIG